MSKAIPKAMSKAKSNKSEISVSWVLYALRATYEREEIRNLILANELKTLGNNVVYGKTFSNEYKLPDLKNYLQQVIKTPDNKIYLFTVSNRPDLKSSETHYQTFIVLKYIKKIYAIDPARTKEGEGIYAPHAGNYILEYFKKNGFETAWNPVEHACQVITDDVFCQTWSLLLQLEMVKKIVSNETLTVCIPMSQDKKYELLLRFYKNNSLKYPNICVALKEEYNISVNSNTDLTNSQKTFLLGMDPCPILMEMNYRDMY